MLCVLLIIISLVFTANSNGRDSKCPDRQFIEQSIAKANIPGAIVMVVNATDILYEQTYGERSLSPHRPLDPDKSIFALGSLSKTLIAVAIMQLVESGQVDLDTDINHYLSSPQRIFHPLYPSYSITLRQLLSHTASIGVNVDMQFASIQPDDIAWTQTTLEELCFAYLSPNASNWLPKPPGNVTLYSNEGTSLAALVIEKVTKMPYEQYVKEKMLKPLGINITQTGFRLSDFSSKEDLVKHYAYAFNISDLAVWRQGMPQLNISPINETFPTWLEIPFFGFPAYPAGLLRMSARSLSLFLRMFMNNGTPLLTYRSIVEMRTVVGGGLIPQYNPDAAENNSSWPPSVQFALIWNRRTMSDGRRFIGQRGTMFGATHLMMVNEQSNVGVIILSNGDITLENALSTEIYNTLTNIQMTLFDCFERKIENASVVQRKMSCILFLFHNLSFCLFLFVVW